MKVFELEIKLRSGIPGGHKEMKSLVRNWISEHTIHEVVDTIAVETEVALDPSRLFDEAAHPMVIFSVDRLALETCAADLATHFDQAIETQIRELKADSWQHAWESAPATFKTQIFHVILAADPVTPDPKLQAIYLGNYDAFGNGQHATTKACLHLIEKNYDRFHWDSALDIGTGSGILAIALAKLGCNRVVGTEIADELVDAASQNAHRNGIKGEWYNCTSPDLHWQPFDVIVCNILIPVLYDMLFPCKKLLAPTGSLILAGFIEKELDLLTEKAMSHGFALVDRLEVRGWLATRWHLIKESTK